MSEPAYKFLDPPGGNAWLPIDEAARRSGYPPRTIRHNCATRWKLHGLARKIDGAWHVHRMADFRFAPRGGASLLHSEAVARLHADGVSARHIEIAENRAAVLDAFGALCGSNRASKLGDLRARFVASWDAQDLPIDPVSVRTLMRWENIYRESGLLGLVPQFAIDTSGAATENRIACHPEALAWFRDHYLTEHKRKIAAVAHVLRGVAAKKGWSPIPSTRWFQKYVRRNFSEDQLVLHREGDRAFAARCMPKVSRDYSDLPAGQRWCGDERTMDIYCRVPDAGGGWKRIRPVLTAWLDERSRLFVGWHLGERANSDTILASFKHGALAFGLPSEVYVDNGKDYRSVAGKSRKGKGPSGSNNPPRGQGPPRRGWDDFDGDRMDSVFSRLEIAATYAIPYQPWSKMIESHFRTVKFYFDQWFGSFCGGSPAERPTGAAGIPTDKLPTLIEVRTAFETFLKAHHEKPQTGSGMDGLAPRQCFEKHRGPIRACSADLLAMLCGRKVGPRVVTANGVRWEKFQYGQADPEVWKLKGRKVWLLLQPDDASTVTLVDESERVLAIATDKRLDGATREHVREAIRTQRRRRKLARQFAEEVLPQKFQTPLGDVLAAQATAARGAQPEDPQSAPTVIRPVRPDLAKSAAKSEPAPFAGPIVFTIDDDPDLEADTPRGATVFRVDDDELELGPEAPPPGDDIIGRLTAG